MNNKIAVIGYGRHGKDTVCEILKNHYMLDFKSSSYFCAEKVIFPVLSNIYGYKTVEECYQDRHNHRKEWYDLIADYNNEDLTRLGKDILKEHSIYCGLRRKEELLELQKQKIIDYTIWVDASERIPYVEDINSCTVDRTMADFIIYNNGTHSELEDKVHYLMHFLLQPTEFPYSF